MIDHQEDIITIDHQEDNSKVGETDNKIIEHHIEKITIEILKEEEAIEITDLQEDNMIEILIEEETIDKITDLQEDNNKDTNQEDKNSDKENQCNGLKSIKLAQEMIESISSLKYFLSNFKGYF